MREILSYKVEFYDFIKEIQQNKNEKVGIVSHNDLDGVTSAIFLNIILENKDIQVSNINFKNYNSNLIKDIREKIKKEKLTRIFILDISADMLDFEDFEILRKETKVFLIDHHPINPLLNNKKNIIKADSNNCVGIILYILGEGFIEERKWKNLVCATMITEFSYKNKDNFEFIKQRYNDFSMNNILDSEPGIASLKYTNLCIYFSKDLNKAYEMILKNDLDDIEKYYRIVQNEIDFFVKKFLEESYHYKEKDIYFFYSNPEFEISSFVASLASMSKPNSIFVLFYDDKEDKNAIRISARNQSLRVDLNNIMKKAIIGLINANAGGHKAASGGKILKKDMEKFKDNLMGLI